MYYADGNRKTVRRSILKIAGPFVVFTARPHESLISTLAIAQGGRVTFAMPSRREIP
jgi:hypothetical protein